MKVSELEGADLDYWVARAENLDAEIKTYGGVRLCVVCGMRYKPSVDWEEGGPFLQKYELGCAFDRPGVWIAVRATGPNYDTSYWSIARGEGEDSEAKTALEAICRAVVRAKFGDEVDPPQTYQQEK